MPGFWTKGQRQFLKALREEEREQVAPLRQRLKSETDPEARQDLKQRIKAIRAGFRRKRRDSRSGLFLKK